MTRLFLSGYISDDNDKITLGSEDSHYIISVLRMRKGEELILVDPDSNELLCEVLETSKDACTVSVKERKKSVSESMIDITLYQSVSKGERMDLTIQKSVELGVKKIVPVFSERCVVRPESDEKKRNSKLERWQKIALEAARQSGRGMVPEVGLPALFGDALLKAKEGNDLVLFPWEEEKGTTLKETLKECSGKADLNRIAVFIGPEGGYSEEEAEKAREAGAVTVTVGKRILRTETAGPAVLAMLLYEFEL